MRRRFKFKINEAGLLCIKVKINNIPGNFIIDTGATASVVDVNQSEYFKINQLEEHEDAGGLGVSKMKSQIAYQNQLTFGRTNLENLQLVLIDLSHVNIGLTSKDIPEIQGIIGADILINYEGIVNYKSNHLSLKI